MSAHTCEDGDTDAEDCRACRAASLAQYNRHGGYHPNLRPLEPGTPWKSREDIIRDYDREDT